jgi:acetyl esterase/lipase
VARWSTVGKRHPPFRYPEALLLPRNGASCRQRRHRDARRRLYQTQEGASEAKWLAAHGIAAFVLQYRLAPDYRYPVPMLDGSRAIRLVRSRSAEFGVDPRRIGVWGFSAGGHLAGFLATEPEQRNLEARDPVERVSAHPDFAILSYARLSMDSTVPRKGNLESLLGPNPTPQMIDQVSIVRHVTRQAAPSFVFSTTADTTVDPLNATAYYDALKRAGVPVELHIFELGPHGAGMGQNLKAQDELEIWPTLLEHWMELHGWMLTASPSRGQREQEHDREKSDR